MAIDWENFLDPYIQAVGELKSSTANNKSIPQSSL